MSVSHSCTDLSVSHSCPELYSRHQHRQTDRQASFYARSRSCKMSRKSNTKFPSEGHFLRVRGVTASSYIVYDCTTRWTYRPVEYICIVCAHLYTLHIHLYTIYLFIYFISSVRNTYQIHIRTVWYGAFRQHCGSLAAQTLQLLS